MIQWLQQWTTATSPPRSPPHHKQHRRHRRRHHHHHHRDSSSSSPSAAATPGDTVAADVSTPCTEVSMDTDFNDQEIMAQDNRILCCGYLFLPSADIAQHITQSVVSIAHSSAGIPALGECATSAYRRQYSGTVIGGDSGAGGASDDLNDGSNSSSSNTTSSSGSSSSSSSSSNYSGGGVDGALEYIVTRYNPHCIAASASGGLSNPSAQKLEEKMQMLRESDVHWSRYWFELKSDGSLSYYDSKLVRERTRGCMMLGNFYVQHSRELYPDRWCFSLIFPNTGSVQLNAASAVTNLYFIRAKTSHEMKQWMRHLRRFSAVERENALLVNVDQRAVEHERQRNEISQKHRDHGGKDIRLNYYRHLLAPARTRGKAHALHISSHSSAGNVSPLRSSASLRQQQQQQQTSPSRPIIMVTPPRTPSRMSSPRGIYTSNDSRSSSSSGGSSGSYCSSTSSSSTSSNSSSNVTGDNNGGSILRGTSSPNRRKRILRRVQRVQSQSGAT